MAVFLCLLIRSTRLILGKTTIGFALLWAKLRSGGRFWCFRSPGWRGFSMGAKGNSFLCYKCWKDWIQFKLKSGRKGSPEFRREAQKKTEGNPPEEVNWISYYDNMKVVSHEKDCPPSSLLLPAASLSLREFAGSPKRQILLREREEG